MKPAFLVESMFDFAFARRSDSVFINRIYWKFTNERIFSLFNFRTPMWIIRDPDIIEKLGIKDFDHFVDHRMIDENGYSIFGNTLFMMSNFKSYIHW